MAAQAAPAGPTWRRRAIILCMAWAVLSTVFMSVGLMENGMDFTTWRTWACAKGLLWRGSPMVIAHYKRSRAGVLAHYKKTWNMSPGHKSELYLGGSAIDSPGRLRGNDCPNNVASRFVRYQSLAATYPMERRGDGRTPPVCVPKEFALEPLCRPFFATVEVVQRNTPIEQIREFVEHYLSIGFGHIYMSCNDTNMEIEEKFKPFVDRGVLSIFRGLGGQTQGHLYFQRRFRNTSFWMARVDIDEFIFPYPPETSIVPLLRPMTGKRGNVPLQLKIGRADFGDSGWETEPPAGVTTFEAYLRSTAVPASVKSIWQTDIILDDSLDTGVGNPHAVVAYDLGGGISCQDYHWVLGSIVCFPQTRHIFWWPPRLPDSVYLAKRPPIAQSVWNEAQRLMELHWTSGYEDSGLLPKSAELAASESAER